MKHVYGPVQSRRLGSSLGISIVPYKVCSLDCVYCQLKQTTVKTVKRKRYIPEREILKELKAFFTHKPPGLKIDYITFSGSGEPTLHSGMGHLIREAKRISSVPIALITNSTTLLDPQVREEIQAADLVIPSLDAVTQSVFEKIDRPLKGFTIDKIIAALIQFRKGFPGTIWLEVMLVRGLNDSVDYLMQFKRVIDLIAPDRVQINAAIRPPAESWVKPPSRAVLKKAREIFGKNCDILL